MGGEDRLTRRTLLGAAALGAGALAGGSDARAQTGARSPNIVFIMADDLGYADVACYGRPDLATPNIDSIAAQGTRFLQAYANSAVCSATRTALITGRYQYRLRIGLEEPLPIGKPDIGLPPEHPTLPSLSRKAGYGTTLIGKWHLGVLPKFGPLKSGYDRFYGFRGGAIDYFAHQGTDHKDDFWNDDAAIKEAGYSTQLFGQRAVDSINAYARVGRPFLISLHFNAPHWPWETVDDQAESDRLRTKTLTDYDGGTQRTYQRMIEAMDLQIGRVLQALDANALRENTIVIFTSDNGGERFADTWPFTGRKTELLEGGLRIPSIISWPGRIPAGQTSDQVSISMDWLPTLLAAAGTAPDPAFAPDGMNLLPVLAQGAPPSPRKLFWRYKANTQAAMRDGDYKFLKIRGNTFLFNVADDPMERANLKDRRKDIYDRLVEEWTAWNATMLPLAVDSSTGFFKAYELADHIGAQ
ncbi:MAG TPA: sulfatase-like hydrolase/transferase [Micropepsaceae bacterium]|nr:sulfatase-like hydrolase/transferase [Micropepsaceae bacterium]